MTVCSQVLKLSPFICIFLSFSILSVVKQIFQQQSVSRIHIFPNLLVISLLFISDSVHNVGGWHITSNVSHIFCGNCMLVEIVSRNFLSKCLSLNCMEGSVGANFKLLCIACAQFEISLTNQNSQTDCSVMMHVIGMCDYWWRQETIKYWPTPHYGG
jgi:hypothetical protein